MATVPTQVRVDEDLKKQAVELFGQLGMDMSSATDLKRGISWQRKGAWISEYSKTLLINCGEVFHWRRKTGTMN